jgi:hypothetical protein
MGYTQQQDDRFVQVCTSPPNIPARWQGPIVINQRFDLQERRKEDLGAFLLLYDATPKAQKESIRD